MHFVGRDTALPPEETETLKAVKNRQPKVSGLLALSLSGNAALDTLSSSLCRKRSPSELGVTHNNGEFHLRRACLHAFQRLSPVARTASLLNGLTAATTTATKTTQPTELLGGRVVPLSVTYAATILAEKPLQPSFKSHLAGDQAPEGL